VADGPNAVLSPTFNADLRPQQSKS
jgi:hypothetical protein